MFLSPTMNNVQFPSNPAPHGSEAVSRWVARWTPLVRPQAKVLDVACGRGRHGLWFDRQGCQVTAVDHDAAAIDGLRAAAPRIEAVLADIEAGPWPFAGRTFDAVVVTHYLWRPLWPALLASLAPGGVLIYETFTEGNESVGKPSRPDFLLRSGELLAVCSSLRVVAFEDGFLEGADGASPRFVQRIAAVREAGENPESAPPQAPGNRPPVRYPLA